MQSHSNLEILGKYGKEDLAILYIGKFNNRVIEFVESIQPPITREEKWVIILSTLYGCPIQCKMCDAGEYYFGKVSKDEMLAQIDEIISQRYPNHCIPVKKLKIQFARMGEPTLNPDVLELLQELPKIYDAPGLLPCLSTVAPNRGSEFLEKLIDIKNKIYPNGQFQLQFSIHSTDEKRRKELMNPSIWSMHEIAEFGEHWYRDQDRKITLNFAVAEDSEIKPEIIAQIFSPEKFLIKLTPINPTNRANSNKIRSSITPKNQENYPLIQEFKKNGFETILSIGEWEENKIGSNCGQFATKFQNKSNQPEIKNEYSCTEYKIDK